MKIKLKKINTRLISSLLVVTLVATPLVGCVENRLVYEVDESGKIVALENIKYEYLKKYKLVVFGSLEEIKFCIVDVRSKGNRAGVDSYVEYYDVFNNELIYSTNIESDLKIIKEQELNDYLVLFDFIKKDYSKDDLEKLLELIEEDFNKNVEKQKIK